jgi:hypothetical protein
MCSRKVLITGLLIVFASLYAAAQVITPMELPDPKLQHLQQRHLQTLMSIGKEIEEHQFPYPVYLSRALDVDVDKMQAADLRSIRFDEYQHRTVLAITGNYYASYAAQQMSADARLKESFNQVIVPILRIEVSHFPDDSEFSAFAFEISHHVRRKVMGLVSEVPENVVVIFPVAAAQQFADAKTEDQAALLDAEIFLNGQPQSFWLGDGAPPEEWKERSSPHSVPANSMASLKAATYPGTSSSNVSSTLLKESTTRIISPATLVGLQRQHQDAIDRLLQGLDSQAHFIAYAPPGFIGFRQGSYLQLSMNTSLSVAPTASRYKIAALAFDEHVSHLIRPLLTYFPENVDFDGVDFSTSIRFSDQDKSEAVEFFFPSRAMRCFAAFECTGQQLLDSGTVIINGERAALDLQVAEGKN